MKNNESICNGIVAFMYFEGLRQKSCPVCWLVLRSEVKQAETILYENVLDPQIRAVFNESLGLCNRHAWLLIDTAKKMYDKLGVSILYLDALRSYLDNFENFVESNSDPSGKCFMCKSVAEAEDRYVHMYRKCLDHVDYARSQAVFCMKHLRMILTERDVNEKKAILDVHKEKLKRIEEKLSSFIEKHSYDNREPITSEEAESVEDAINSLKGIGGSTVRSNG